jgi:N-acyl-D-amino-acid deacylase
MRFDLLIQNAQVIDGTGSPSYRANVGIVRDRISVIGQVERPAKRIIDAHSLVLAPGFIDPHSHADLILPLPPERQTQLMKCKIMQGITTTIIGNCGLGVSPQTPDAEPILRAVVSWMTPERITWPWRGFGDFLNRLEDNGVPLNVGALVPHGPVRISVMGLRKGAPTISELRRMRALVEEAVEAGALGLSTGLIYPPGMYSAFDELVKLAKVVARYDGIYTSHVRGSSELLIPAVGELIEVGRQSRVRVHHSHNEAVGSAHWPKIDRVLEMEEWANREGVRLTFDMFPYTAAATMMIAIYPPWSLEGGIEKLIERLTDPKTRARIEHDIERVSPSWPPWQRRGWPHNLVRAVGWRNIHIGSVQSRRNKKYERLNLEELAGRVGRAPFDAISDLIIEEAGQVSMLIFGVSGDRDQDAHLTKYVRHPLGAFCTDAEDYGRGRPHPAAYGAFSRILSRFVQKERVLPLEEAVRKMTSYPAQIFGLKDRGLIRPGAYADLVLFEPEKIRDRATFEKPRQLAQGMEYVIINGRIVVERGEFIGERAGMILRRGNPTHTITGH